MPSTFVSPQKETTSDDRPKPRADDGSTMLQTNVDYIHQAFQRLIDWSIDEVNHDVCAVISGPNGFYANHRIKAAPDFAWIQEEKASSEAFA